MQIKGFKSSCVVHELLGNCPSHRGMHIQKVIKCLKNVPIQLQYVLFCFSGRVEGAPRLANGVGHWVRGLHMLKHVENNAEFEGLDVDALAVEQAYQVNEVPTSVAQQVSCC